MGLQLGLLKASPRPSYFHHWPQITALPSPTFGEFSNTSSGEQQGKNNNCRWDRLHGAAGSGGRGQAAGRTGDLALASPEEQAGSGGLRSRRAPRWGLLSPGTSCSRSL